MDCINAHPTKLTGLNIRCVRAGMIEVEYQTARESVFTFTSIIRRSIVYLVNVHYLGPIVLAFGYQHPYSYWFFKQLFSFLSSCVSHPENIYKNVYGLELDLNSKKATLLTVHRIGCNIPRAHFMSSQSYLLLVSRLMACR